MLRNSYWRLTPKATASNDGIIVELTSDGLAYVWPLLPGEIRLEDIPDTDQDPEALIADGDFLEYSGFYHHITDFMTHSKYLETLYVFEFLGDFESIRACRTAVFEGTHLCDS